jgi:hemoglobin/transferrin/lactoferrin receptor protein
MALFLLNISFSILIKHFLFILTHHKDKSMSFFRILFFFFLMITSLLAQETKEMKETEAEDSKNLNDLPESEILVPSSKATKTAKEELLLPEIVVTATRNKEEQFELPYTTTTITRDELRRKQARALPEALRDVPGVMMQKTANGQGSPYLRGFTGFRTLLLIDGIRLNNSVFREGPNQYWATVDPLSLDKIEVVQGPSSVLYGSDAIGGTVNVFTKERKRYNKAFEANALLSTRYSSAEASSISRIEGSANVGQHFGIIAGQNYKQYGDVDAGGDQGRLKRTGFYELNSDAKMNVFLTDKVELIAAYYGVEQENLWRTHSTIFAESFRNSDIGTDRRRRLDQERHLGYIRLNVDKPADFINYIRVTGSFHFQEEEEDRLRSNGRADLQGVKVSTSNLSYQMSSCSVVGKWTYGFEYYHDYVRSYRNEHNANGTFRSHRIQGPVADNATYDLLGFYVQDEIEFHPHLKGTLGVRYTHAWVDANEIEDPQTGRQIRFSDNWGSFVGNANLVAEVHENVNLYLGGSQGFRSPNLSDLTRLDSARSGEVETPSPGLDPEKYLSLEIGMNAKHPWFQAHLAYYYTFIDDMIIRFPTGRLIGGDHEVQKENAGDGFVHGVNLSGEVFLPQGFSVFGNFAWMEGRVSVYPTSDRIEKDEPIDRLQPAQGILGLKWTSKEWGLTLEASTEMVRQAKRLSTSNREDTQRIAPEGTPGYGILNLRAEWEVNEYCTISVAVENVLDKHYRIHGSGQDEPGINGIVSIELEF